MMNPYPIRRKRGVTLIELLIVIAMIAIFSAGTMAIITGPAQEQVLATSESTIEQGMGTLVAKLVEDSHAALSATADSDRLTLNFSDKTVSYFVNEQRQLRRAVSRADAQPQATAGAALLDRVEKFSAQQNGPLWQVTITSKAVAYQQSRSITRTLNLRVGQPRGENQR